MHVLVTWGSKRGGTEGVARIIGEVLEQEGHQVTLLPGSKAAAFVGFDAAVVGGALYATRWHRDARRFVARRKKDLRTVPVWFFSSGPLDESAEHGEIPPTKQVQILMERVGAQGHVTFGGRLTGDAQGFPASAMARKRAGDWRHPERVRAWASDLARALPAARPGVAIAQAGGSIARLVAHGIAGWALCAVTMGALLAVTSPATALVVHALTAPVLFAFVARRYFEARGARDPLPTALGFVGIVASLDAVVVAGLIQHSLRMFGSVLGSWVPLLLIFAVTWAAGTFASMTPPPRPALPRRA
jgi:menaquinone-dependent protoporphyrinogen oxidase